MHTLSKILFSIHPNTSLNSHTNATCPAARAKDLRRGLLRASRYHNGQWLPPPVALRGRSKPRRYLFTHISNCFLRLDSFQRGHALSSDSEREDEHTHKERSGKPRMPCMALLTIDHTVTKAKKSVISPGETCSS